MRIALAIWCVILAGCGTVPQQSLSPRNQLQVRQVSNAVHDAVTSGCHAAVASWIDQCRSLDLARFGAVQSFDIVEVDPTPRGSILYVEVSFRDSRPAVLTIDCEDRQAVLIPLRLSLAWPNLERRIHLDPPRPGGTHIVSS